MVDTAVPVVDFYLNVLTEDLDLKDTKAKAQVVDALLPVLRAVANPIERDDYLQKIARTLRVSPDSIRTQLQGKRPTQRISRPEQPASSTPTPARSSESDMERYCLSAFLKRPSLLQRVNQTLNTLGLDPISDNDFQETACRAIFQTWQNMVEQEESDPVKALRNQTPDHLQEEIDALLTSKDKALSNSHLERDVAQTLLRLRERNLKQTVANLEILTREAQSNGDSQAREYAQSMMTYTQTLFKTQKALAQV